MARAHHPIFDPAERELTEGGFAREEVRLANRNPGTLLESLRHDVTPAGLHYLLIHFDLPHVASAADWRLEIGGLVERRLSLGLDELKRGPQRTLGVTLECAGNGRAAMSPRPARPAPGITRPSAPPSGRGHRCGRSSSARASPPTRATWCSMWRDGGLQRRHRARLRT